MEATAPGDPGRNVSVDPRHSFGTFTEAHGTTATVWLSGDCDAAAAPRLHATLEPLVHSDMRWVRVDLKQVTFLDSVALSIILEARAQLQPGGDLELAEPSVPVTRLLHAAGVDAVLGDSDQPLDRADLEQRIDGLTAPQRQVLSEYFGEAQPIGDVAATHHVSMHQAKQLLAEAVDALEARRPPVGG